MSDIRDDVARLKRHFLAWRVPPVELPSDSVIEDVVRAIRDEARNAALEEAAAVCDTDEMQAWDKFMI